MLEKELLNFIYSYLSSSGTKSKLWVNLQTEYTSNLGNSPCQQKSTVIQVKLWQGGHVSFSVRGIWNAHYL